MIETIKLENGITIVMESMPYVRSISFGIFVKNGSINEIPKNNGISHFIEHMFFKGTKKRTAKKIAEEMDAIGGQLNAFTSKEYTCYYARVLDTHIDLAIDVLSDMLINSTFDETEIEKEANVILEEITMYEDSPEDIVFNELQKYVWKNSTLGYSILGIPQNIKNFKQKDFFDYIDKTYVGENIVISIVGNFEKNKILKKLTNIFSKINKGTYNNYDDLKQDFNKSVVKTEKDIEQLHLCLAFEGIALNNKYRYAINILNSIFGGGMSSYLFQKIREQNGLAYSIYSHNYSFINNGIFNIYAGLNPTQLNKVIEMIIDEIKLLKLNKISEEQIKSTKEQIKSNYIMSLESTYNRMASIGKSQLLLNQIKTSNEIIDEIDKIKTQDIDNLIDELFDLNKISASIVCKNIEKVNVNI